MAPTIAVSIDELRKMQTTEEVMSWRAIARAFYGAQFWIEQQAMTQLERISTAGDLHAPLMDAYEAADADFLEMYRRVSDAGFGHDVDAYVDHMISLQRGEYPFDGQEIGFAIGEDESRHPFLY